MPAIFISHSGLDQQIANDVKAALEPFGFEQVFLDFDKETGIDAGENWEKRLYEELSRCHAVILVLTPSRLLLRRSRRGIRYRLANRKVHGRDLLHLVDDDLLRDAPQLFVLAVSH